MFSETCEFVTVNAPRRPNSRMWPPLYRPPPFAAWFFEIVLPVTVTLPPSVKRPPLSAPVRFWVMVEFSTMTMLSPQLAMPAPPPSAAFSETVELEILIEPTLPHRDWLAIALALIG